MGKLKIVAGGGSQQAKAQARGKLFEKLMTDVLRHYGYKINRIPGVNYAGMEIDIEGEHITSEHPLYSECKCYETEIDSPKLQQFFGKYSAMWFKNNHSHGLFIALPGINSHARGFYNSNCENNTKITVRIYEEEQVLAAIFRTQSVKTPEYISGLITNDIGTAGDWLLMYTDKGLFWIQYVIPLGGGVSSSIAIFDAAGRSISERDTLEYLSQLYPELNDFKKIFIEGSNPHHPQNILQDEEEVVEVRGSSECFEYQFPASPQYFVGREAALDEVTSFAMKVVNKEISSRGLLFEANSGWGKSSAVLACIARLNEMGHFAVAIDSRSASSSQFIMRVVEHAFKKFANFRGLLAEDQAPKAISGFDGAYRSLLRVGKELEAHRKCLFIFLDQFENVFFQPDTLRRVSDLLLKLCDAETNIVLGFSWKIDLIGGTNDFPYQMRDSIRSSSIIIPLDTFSDIEINALLDKLGENLQTILREDLRFLLSDFSQGYPWLLKKLCAHVKTQIDSGIRQSDIANSLLNVEELFKEDLHGLSPEEEEVLREIAKKAPIGISELGDEFKPYLVQSLVNRRLIVRIGSKFDVYWDIFRDYLNSGQLPVQDNYVMHFRVGNVLAATKLLVEAGGLLLASDFQQKTGLSKKSFYNIIRDLRLLGLATVEQGNVKLKVNVTNEDFEGSMRIYLKERLKRNRLVKLILDELVLSGTITLTKMSEFLAKSCPYISAKNQTWLTYSRNFADWIDFVDLAIFDREESELNNYRPGAEVRERKLILARRRNRTSAPGIQYTPLVRTAERLMQAIESGSNIDWSGIKKSTISKSLGTLEDLGFIIQKKGSVIILPKIKEFVDHPERRASLFAEGAIKIYSFAVFIEILRSHENRIQFTQLALELKEKLGARWTDETAIWYTKIMMNWATNAKLKPRIWSHQVK